MTQLEKVEQKFDFFQRKEKYIKPVFKSFEMLILIGALIMFAGSLVLLANDVLVNKNQPFLCDFTKGTFVKINDLSK